MASVSIEVKISDELRKRLLDINSPTTMMAIHNSLAKHCDPYVPFLNGFLSQTHVIGPEGVCYIVPYARYQYFGENFHHTTEFHPLASAKWDEAMMRDHGEEFEQEVRDILDWRLNRFGKYRQKPSSD